MRICNSLMGRCIEKEGIFLQEHADARKSTAAYPREDANHSHADALTVGHEEGDNAWDEGVRSGKSCSVPACAREHRDHRWSQSRLGTSLLTT